MYLSCSLGIFKYFVLELFQSPALRFTKYNVHGTLMSRSIVSTSNLHILTGRDLVDIPHELQTIDLLQL